MSLKSDYEKLVGLMVEREHVAGAVMLLDWDAQVNMPPKGAKGRGQTTAVLSGILHDKLVSKEYSELLLKLHKAFVGGQLNEDQAAVVRESYRVYLREVKLSKEFVVELSATCSESHGIWDKAKKVSDFNLFAPILTKIVQLKRKQAEYLGHTISPYDALLDEFEPNFTSEDASVIFNDLKKFLVPFIQKIKDKGIIFDKSKMFGKFDLIKQKEFNEVIAKQIGYDFEAGRMDTASHPFMTTIHPGDFRVTTRYDEKDYFYSLSSAIHEVGHALYEQGLKPEHFGTPLGSYLSLGVHESQSRTWENIVGKSLSFWKYFYPKLQNFFPEPYSSISVEEFYKLINNVGPSLIRVESDEVTYNLHIIIRFEIEKELIEGSIEVSDLPKIWSAKYKEYLGVDVPNDGVGVLQDVHWASGLFGYFPTYTLGNLYSAQFYQQAKKEVMNMEQIFEKGQFQPFLEWLRKNIHQHGKLYTASELCVRVTGEPLNSKYYIDYLKEKFGSLYKI